jgi:hypothetical protein
MPFFINRFQGEAFAFLITSAQHSSVDISASSIRRLFGYPKPKFDVLAAHNASDVRFTADGKQKIS